MTSRTTPSPSAEPVPPAIGPARTILSIILIVIATAVQVELCRAQMRGLVPEGVEVLSRGPVHEAFASLQTFDPQPGRIVTRAAPPLIDEIPPNQRPAGVNLGWIPGYWAWDDERMDFIWLSGTWRALPPGREWIAGYWAQVPSGYQWTSGYWADSVNRQATYLPPPPPSLEAGPYVPAPSVDFLWSPGCWIWFQARYAWQPGYWALGRPDWDWIPAHNVWTPRGHVFVTGYWDHPVDHRGLLFAPVWFDPGVLGSGRFLYSPRVAVDLNRFVDHLFLRPAFQHYYFGDYYAASYAMGGYFSSLAFTSGRHGHDPIHSHQVWEHRWDPGWPKRMDAAFQDRRDHPSTRPARTWPPVGTGRSDAPPMHEPVEGLARPYDQLQRRDRSLLRYQSVSSPERTLLKTRAEEVETSREQRRLRESPSTESSARSPRVAPSQLRVPPSPIRSLPSRELPRDQVPPRFQRAPGPSVNSTHGTIEHLLVMPVRPFEIMLSKVWSMGLVVLVSACFSLIVVVQGFLGVPIDGSVPLFLAGAALHLFATTSMGIFLATLARSMPQFGLLTMLVLLPMQLLSGSATPRESMPGFVQQLMLAAPTTHFVSLGQAILFRGAGLTVVWPQFLALALIGSAFFALTLHRFRSAVSQMA